MALYFAASGIGQVRSGADEPGEPYTSPARVLLNGLGSDELLGGYGRFKTAFKVGGWRAVVDEVGQLTVSLCPNAVLRVRIPDSHPFTR